uniref:Uncharacterized protein n=1 Tax=Macrostomum lignano TaxID=282301 RepID=A0A1I8FX57_9PLAT
MPIDDIVAQFKNSMESKKQHHHQTAVAMELTASLMENSLASTSASE